MSRLDSAIRRLEAQRLCLNEAARLIDGIPGPAIEIGLGNGRSYDHLRQILPGREIFVFDRRVAAHPDCIPDSDHMILGDVRDTLDDAAARIGAPAVLAHLDVGSGRAGADTALADFIGTALTPLLAAGAIVVADQAVSAPGWRTLELPDSVPPGRYFMYKVEA